MSRLDLADLPADNAWLRRLAHGLARGEPDAEDRKRYATTRTHDDSARVTTTASGIRRACPSASKWIEVAAAGFHPQTLLLNLDATKPLVIALTPSDQPNPALDGIGVVGIVAHVAETGLTIAEVKPGTAAAQAGLVGGDTIVTIDGMSAVELGKAGAGVRERSDRDDDSPRD